MEHLTDILNVIGDEFSKIKNKFVRKKVIEGMDCAEGYLDIDGECMKEIKTVNILLTIPIANTIILSVFALISAAFLYKFKSTPLSVNKTGTKCKEVDLSRIFKKNILEGVVWDDEAWWCWSLHRCEARVSDGISLPLGQRSVANQCVAGIVVEGSNTPPRRLDIDLHDVTLPR